MGKVVIVTGAGRGIGAAIARQAAAGGYAVAVNYHSDEAAAQALVAAIRANGGQALAIQADVAVQAEVARLFARTEAELGPPTALVNNAGITGRIASFMDTEPATIEAVFRTNVHGVMHCSRAGIDADRHPRRGRRTGAPTAGRAGHPDGTAGGTGGNRGSGAVAAVAGRVLRDRDDPALRRRNVAAPQAIFMNCSGLTFHFSADSWRTILSPPPKPKGLDRSRVWGLM